MFRAIRFVTASLLVIGSAATAISSSHHSDLEPVAQLPSFVLTDHREQQFDRGALAGSVWIVDFIFTRCRTVCPRLTSRMARLQEGIAAREAIGLLSISVDPDFDTPKVLASYASRHGSNDSLWRFLTGPADDVKTAVVDGFFLPMAQEPTPEDEFAVLHSEKFVLVDDRGRIRGYYDADERGTSQVLADARLLLRAGLPSR